MLKAKRCQLILFGFFIFLVLGCEKLHHKLAANLSLSESVPLRSSLRATLRKPKIQHRRSDENFSESLNTKKLEVEAWQYLYDNKDKLLVCNGNNNFYIFQYYPLVYQINSGSYLVELVCNRGGLHNGVEYFLYYPNSENPQVLRLYLDRFVKNESGVFFRQTFNSIAGATRYDSERQILSVFSRAIRVATCGSLARYKLEDEEFKLLEYRYQECQSGNLKVIPPEQYPQIYP